MSNTGKIYSRGSDEFNEAVDILLDIEDNAESLTNKGFSVDFVDSVVTFMGNRDYVTEKQYTAIVNIKSKWLKDD